MNNNLNKNISLFDKYYSHINRIVFDFNFIKALFINWYDILFFKLNIKKVIYIKFKSGEGFTIKNKQQYIDFWKNKDIRILITKNFIPSIIINQDNISFVYKDEKVNFKFQDNKNLINTLDLIIAQFYTEEYKWLDVSKKEVVDIGANIGDTAIYFSLSNAKKIHSYEPYPYSYNLAKKNIEINKMQKKIILNNAGVGEKNSQIIINDKYKNVGGSELKTFKKGKSIKILSLENITTSLKLNNSILKIDCEGYEYKILLNTKSKTLRKFKKIMIEYHYGYKNLEKKLKRSGFKVKHSNPIFTINENTVNKEMFYGFIFAERI